MKPEELYEDVRIPLATYRVQFNKGFGFKDLKDAVPYLYALGISDIYSAPYLMAKPGSGHGYDIIDHGSLNPEVGTEEDYEGLLEALRLHSMGQLFDIVPNHMCITGGNRWWTDVLENGESSPYAGFFDIDWNPLHEGLMGKVLLPILGEQYGNVLESGALTLCFEGGAFFFGYYEHRLPLDPSSYGDILRPGAEALEKDLGEDHKDFQELMSILTAIEHLPPNTMRSAEAVAERQREKEVIKRRLLSLYENSPETRKHIEKNTAAINGMPGEAESFDLLDKLISRQPYRLSHWRVATDEINYRRFFDINDLAAIRVEIPEVFEESHRFVLKLVREGKVTGLRVDHVDGLYNPIRYLRKLQEECFVERAKAKGLGDEASIRKLAREKLLLEPPAMPFYVIGEKILLKGERLPEDWPVFSTTGYVFMNTLNGLFVEAENSKLMDDIYCRFIKERPVFSELLYEKKKLVMETSMSGELNVLGHRLDMISERFRHTRDFTRQSLTKALADVAASFPVYRTYIDPSGANDRDRRYIELAVGKAKRKNPAMSSSIFDFLKDVLLLARTQEIPLEERDMWLDFVMKFEQFTGPVMAKGLEDTAFYVYNRLISLNEVGGSPDRFGISIEAFHGQNIERNKFWPHAMLSSSTHDSKRSEDARARINVLSEIPSEWRKAVFRWSKLNKKKKPAVDGLPVPDRNEEYLFYQSLVGVWPFEGPEESLRERIKTFMLKAVREAKTNTSWINPNSAYEEALMEFIDKALSSDGAFIRDFAPFASRVSRFGMLNSLSQCLLKAASPGVPDYYQGMELWSFSLVDPDNRRPVDYALRADMLKSLKAREEEGGTARLAQELLMNMTDGSVKLFATQKALGLRKRLGEVFMEGQYVPLEARGEFSGHVCAFLRKGGGRKVLVSAPRLFVKLMKDAQLPIGETVWKDTRVYLPEGGRFRDVFTGVELEAERSGGETFIPASLIFGGFPVFLAEDVQ